MKQVMVNIIKKKNPLPRIAAYWCLLPLHTAFGKYFIL